MQKDVYKYVQAGVSGFIHKDANADDYYNIIKSVFHGSEVLSQKLSEQNIPHITDCMLIKSEQPRITESVRMTKCERKLAEGTADGPTNKDMAHTLHLSNNIVRSKIRSTLKNMALRTRG